MTWARVRIAAERARASLTCRRTKKRCACHGGGDDHVREPRRRNTHDEHRHDKTDALGPTHRPAPTGAA
jgi:hypothetical protein